MKTKPTKIKLKHYERIVAVEPKICNGPVWCNEPTLVYILNERNCRLRAACIQPEERTLALDALFKIGAIVAKELIAAIPWERVE